MLPTDSNVVVCTNFDNIAIRPKVCKSCSRTEFLEHNTKAYQ